MKRKLMSIITVLVLSLSLVLGVSINVVASEENRVVDGSELTNESELTGTAVKKTRGEFLQTGYSKIVRIGPGKLYAGGSTLAQKTVESVQVNVMLEKCAKDEDVWYFVDGWTKENVNADLVSTSKRFDVEGGCYYRVRCTHAANFDVSSSFTDGLFIEKP